MTAATTALPNDAQLFHLPVRRVRSHSDLAAERPDGKHARHSRSRRDIHQSAIASGELKAGDRLPSAPKLAERIGVNFNTVAKAYRDLDVKGYIQTRRGMGVFVKAGSMEKCRSAFRESVVKRMHEVVAEARSAGIGSAAIQEIANKCLDSKAAPYDVTPKALLALAKKV